MKKFLLVLLCLTLFTSCKNEKDSNTKGTIVSVVEPSRLQLKINCKSDKPDVLQCAFNRIEFKNNREGNYIITDKIATSQESKLYNFEMFDDNIVTLLQVKFGKQEKNVVVDNIILKYGKTIITIKGNEIDKYFAFNKFIEYSPENSIIKTLKIDGKHFPSMTLKKGHINKLFNLIL